MPLLDVPDHDPGGVGLLGDGKGDGDGYGDGNGGGGGGGGGGGNGDGDGDGDGLVSRPARKRILTSSLWASIASDVDSLENAS